MIRKTWNEILLALYEININIKQECIPVRCTPSASVVTTRCQYQGVPVSRQGSRSPFRGVQASSGGSQSLYRRVLVSLSVVWSHSPFKGGLSLPPGEAASWSPSGGSWSPFKSETKTPCERNERRFWKHYLPATSLAGGNDGLRKHLDMHLSKMNLVGILE